MTARVGYVGLDHHHRDPYLAIASALDVDVTAVCEPGRNVNLHAIGSQQDRPDEITTEGTDIASVLRGAETYVEPEALLADADVDVLWLTYRNDRMPAIVEAAVEHGVDVLCEKPMARTAADLAPVAARVTDADITVTPTLFYRHNPIARDLRDRMEDGSFGDVWSVEGRFVASQLVYRDTDHYVYDAETSRGGALQWIGPHWLDAMPWLLDDPIERVDAQVTDADEIDVEVGGTVQFETAGGTLGTFQTGYYLDDRGKDTHLGIYGSEGQARTPMHHDSLQEGDVVPIQITTNEQEAERTIEHTFTYDRFPAWGDFVLEFFEAFFERREAGDAPATIEDAMRLLAVLDAAYESAEDGGWVTVDRS